MIDFSKFLDGDERQRQETAQAILHGFQDAGFIYLKNVPISSKTRKHVFETSAKFFKLPMIFCPKRIQESRTQILLIEFMCAFFRVLTSWRFTGLHKTWSYEGWQGLRICDGRVWCDFEQ